jgi:hypothetical protein
MIPRKATDEEIHNAMKLAGGNVSAAARSLGLDEATVRRRISKNATLSAIFGIKVEKKVQEPELIAHETLSMIKANERDMRQIVTSVFENIGISDDTIAQMNAGSMMDKDPVGAMEFMLQFAQQSQITDMAILQDMVMNFQRKAKESDEYPEESQGFYRLALKAFEMKQKSAKAMIDSIQNLLAIYARKNSKEDGAGSFKPTKIQPTLEV